jgi:micrococcal nuclease
MTARSSLLLFFSFFLFLGAFSCTAADEAFIEGRVSRVFDGDTVEIAGAGRVRLLGIDAPEFEASDRDRFYLRQGVSEARLRRIAFEARGYVAALAQGKKVRLVFDGERRDSYGRYLAYVILPDGRDLNRLLVEEGYAAVYLRFEFERKEGYLAAEREARAKKRGMWGD